MTKSFCILGRNYAIIREYSSAEAPLEPLEMQPTKRSTFAKIRKATFGKPSKGDPSSSAPAAVLDRANSSSQKANSEGSTKDALDVVLRMEVNQKDPSGNTKPYRLIVPVLKCERAAAGGGAGSSDSGGGWI